VAQDVGQAIAWCRKAAEQSHAEAQFSLGQMYKQGRGVAHDRDQVIVWYRKAADQGHAEAQFYLGEMYENGHGVLEDYVEAYVWYVLAAANGLDKAAKNRDKIRTRMSQAQVAAGLRRVVAWHQQAADLNDATVQFNLGQMYDTEGNLPDDYVEAYVWYSIAAANGNPVAAINRDKIRRRMSQAQVAAGLRRMVAWYQQTADLNDAKVQFNLGQMYDADNPIEAYAWYILAAANGHQKAAESRENMRQRMGQAQIAAGQQRAKALQTGLESKDKLAVMPPEQALTPDATPAPNRTQPPNSRPSSTGSGFLITGGYVITCFHVVKGAQRIAIRYQGADYATTVTRQDAANDLAVLKVNSLNAGAPPRFTATTRLGDRVFTMGFPHLDMQGDTVKYTDGVISSLAGPNNAPLYYQISVPVQSGNSGGPLFDDVGNLVGVVAAKLNVIKALQVSGDLPQNVNYAVKADYLLPLLKSIDGLPPPSFSPHPLPGEKPDMSSLIEQLQPFAVLVLAY